MTRPTPIRRFRSLAANLERWFLEEQRDLPWRREYDPYEIWVAEVMLQQTRMEVVVPYFRRFVARFPDVAALAAASEADVLAVWSGLGYYRRARMLHQGAKFLAGRGGAMPDREEELRSIPGVGRYTAGAIASIAFDRAAAVVDGNVARVASRLERLDAPLGSAALAAAEWEWAERLVRAARSPRALNQGLMELGARICRPRNPLCGRCPLARSCKARAAGDPESYPRRPERPRPLAVRVRLFLVSDGGGRVLLQRGGADAAFGGMFHLPHGCARILGRDDSARFDSVAKLGVFTHAITNRRVSFEVWSAVP
ncbi:MAG TPA: A/G-specific adenine glycosylase, partial [Thermoanaerobaculia bacterium]|nr:A/G-specific adenine glycosylase [Thermoanaerobaculia bacterium]